MSARYSVIYGGVDVFSSGLSLALSSCWGTACWLVL